MSETRKLAEAPSEPPPAKALTPEAQRALAEAAERRRLAEENIGAAKPAEHGGQKGPDPARYGDWEKGGIVSDF